MKMMKQLTQILQSINVPTAAPTNNTAKKNHKFANYRGRNHKGGDSKCWELEKKQQNIQQDGLFRPKLDCVWGQM